MLSGESAAGKSYCMEAVTSPEDGITMPGSCLIATTLTDRALATQGYTFWMGSDGAGRNRGPDQTAVIFLWRLFLVQLRV